MQGMPVPDTAHFVHIGMDPPVINDVAQAIYMRGIEVTFGPFEVEEISPQPVKDHFKVSFMLLNSVQVDEYIIQAYMHKSADDVLKYGCHHTRPAS
jgi:hypothetical protein